MSALTNLELVRVLLTDPEHWCQRAFALDAAGRYRTATSPEAVRWCLAGALDLARPGPERDAAFAYLDLAAMARGYAGPTHANDHSDHAGVLAVIDDAIHLARKDGKP